MRNKLVTVTVENGKRRYTYEKFRFLFDWVIYMDETRKSDERDLTLFHAIVRYGCYEMEPEGLSDKDLEYFNTEVRPELERQHEILKKGGRL